MKNFIILLFFIFSSLAFADEFDQFFKFTGNSTEPSLNPKTLEQLKQEYSFDQFSKKINGKIEIVKSSNPQAEMTFIYPKDSKSKFKILVSESALKDDILIKQFNDFMSRNYLHYHQILEAMTNARLGDLEAKRNLIYLKIESYALGGGAAEINQTQINELKLQAKSLDKEIKLNNSMANKAFTERKAIFDELDNAKGQLKDLITQNKRKEVVKLLNHYLPWEHFTSLEKEQWKIWLEAIENPAPLKERVFVLRGLDKGQFFLTEKGSFLMGPIIIKNQGSYNRRLRSLTTMLDKSISSTNLDQIILNDDKLKPSFNTSSRLTNMYFNHSKDPLGSPFISFTKDLGVAKQFANEGITVVALDPRLAIGNLTSNYTNEVEILAPLFTFPEDNIGFFDKNTPGNLKDNIISKLNELDIGDGEELFSKHFQNHDFASSLKFYPKANDDFLNFTNYLVKNKCNLTLSPGH
jgi:hypothetical protein